MKSNELFTELRFMSFKLALELLYPALNYILLYP